MPTSNTSIDTAPCGVPASADRRVAARITARRGLIALGCSLAAVALAPALATAAPTVKAKAKILPIPGFPHTGNFLGGGADLETTFEITGSEYDGGPPPLKTVKVYFPKGTKIDTKAFPTCTGSALIAGGAGAPACKKSKAGPKGETHGFVSLGGERVEETVYVYPFFVSGGIDFWIEGEKPVKIEKLATGSWAFPSSGPVLTVEVPLIETVQEAPDASATMIKNIAGGAIKKNGKTVYYGTLPKKCPAGGFPAKAEVTFGSVSEPKIAGETVTASTKVPCPTKKA